MLLTLSQLLPPIASLLLHLTLGQLIMHPAPNQLLHPALDKVLHTNLGQLQLLSQPFLPKANQLPLPPTPILNHHLYISLLQIISPGAEPEGPRISSQLLLYHLNKPRLSS